MSGSEAIIKMLLAHGVKTVFGYPGGAIMPFYDALFDYQKELHHVLVRHEQGAAHAAEGYANASGEVGVCIATSGPGATNLVTGIADAMMDSVPMVAITGQVVSPLLGTDAFQETDVIGITIPITKWNCQMTDPKDIPYMMAKAFYVARHGRPGPVVVDITKDAQINTFDWKDIDFKIKPQKHYAQRYSDAKLQRAADLINAAERPLLLVGHGVLIGDACHETCQFMEKGNIPAAATYLGLSAVPTDHPLYMGMLGMHGNYAPNILTNEADLIIGLGMRFDDRVTGNLKHYAIKAKIIHIEIDPAEVGKIIKPTVSLIGEAKDVLTELLPLLENKDRSAWLARFSEGKKKELETVIESAIHPKEGALRTSEVINLLSELTNHNAVVVSDVGQQQMMTARYYQFKKPRSYVGSGGLGTMGYALPAAIGAAFAIKDRPVLAIIGDGGFQMTIQELGTIAQEKLSVKIVIMNNNYLGMVRQWQELFFAKRYSATPMHNPNFVKICEGYGIESMKVSERSQIKSAIEKMLSTPGAFCLEVAVETEQNVWPMVPAGASVSDIRLK
ncbi:MAG: biosynthetic-type acetolactate synthase large subunit [Deltaproteobacteria bacterium]|nr:biosynthetic-type acetolactate synthase large subunit [Deltaproteobacteria bacterium]